MKINAKYTKHLYNQKSQAEVTFLIENYRHTQMLNELSDDKVYAIEIKERKSKRSINQNAFLWAMLHELDKHTSEDMMYWYIMALTDTDSKHEYLLGIDSIEQSLMSVFRAVKKVGKRQVDGKELSMFKCFYGSSKMNVKEMNELIDTVLRYCAELNINVEEYRKE